MGKALIIAEKPSVARDIVAALGGFSQVPQTPQGVSLWESDHYVCGHSLGHILELYEPEDYSSQYKQWRLQDLPIVPDSFLLKAKSQTAQILRLLKHQLARPDITSVINACDAAREGELIFREIMQHALCDKEQFRVWLQSLTHESIRSAFANKKPAAEYQGLANAAFGRMQADWLIGMNLSRAATLKLSRASEGGVWSIGRVQTPTLAMLVEREFSILSHDAAPYHLLKATFKDANGHTYQGVRIDPSFKWDELKPHLRRDRIFDEIVLHDTLKKLQVGDPGTARDSLKTKEQKAPVLFSLTALQRFMANRYKWTAKYTLEVAQKCYEQYKIITYPRTESDALPMDHKDKVRAIFGHLTKFSQYQKIADELLENPWQNEDVVFNDAAISDHFAIVPTGVFPSSLPKDEGLLFDAVIRRLMASLMPPAIIDQIERRTQVHNQIFVSGPEELIRNLGWQRAIQISDSKDAPKSKKSEWNLKPLPPNQDQVSITQLTPTKEQTKPPHRLGEAQLLTLMEHAGRHVDDPDMARVLRETGGLGTAATRAEIIENLKQKDYVFANLQPTVKGLHLIRFLKLARAEMLTSPLLTAELESHLHLVEQSARTRDSFIQETTESVTSSFKAVANFDLEKTFDHAPSLGPCPRCDQTVHERMWNYSCSSNRTVDHPCGFTLTKDVMGRWLDPPTVSRLLASKEQGLVVDQFPMEGKSGSARRLMLKLAQGLLEICSEHGVPLSENFHTNETKSSTKKRVTWGSCPVHTSDGCLIVETKNAFICETKLRNLREGHMDSIGFQLPKSICQRTLKFEDINSFIHKGKTKTIEGFKSKGGKTFNAAIIRNPAGQWTFEFSNR